MVDDSSELSPAVRTAYLRLVRGSASAASGASVGTLPAQDALANLSTEESVGLLSLLNCSPGELSRIFDGDAEMLAAISAVPPDFGEKPISTPAGPAPGLMDPMVLRALSTFERNIAMCVHLLLASPPPPLPSLLLAQVSDCLRRYVQRPQRIRELEAGLSAAQVETLTIALCDCYPLAVLHQVSAGGGRARSAQPRGRDGVHRRARPPRGPASDDPVAPTRRRRRRRRRRTRCCCRRCRRCVRQGLERQRSGDAPLDIAGHILGGGAAGGGGRGAGGGSDSLNEARVAELFRRVLADFPAYKRSPQSYEGWLAGCSRQERRMLEALITAFWDWSDM
jgi:hypothetical protein